MPSIEICYLGVFEKTVKVVGQSHVTNNNYGNYLNLRKNSLHFELLASNSIENKVVKKIQKFTRNKFSKIFIHIPGTYKKNIRHTNKCPKQLHKII